MKKYQENQAKADVIDGIIFGILMIVGMYIGLFLIPPAL